MDLKNIRMSRDTLICRGGGGGWGGRRGRGHFFLYWHTYCCKVTTSFLSSFSASSHEDEAHYISDLQCLLLVSSYNTRASKVQVDLFLFQGAQSFNSDRLTEAVSFPSLRYYPSTLFRTELLVGIARSSKVGSLRKSAPPPSPSLGKNKVNLRTYLSQVPVLPFQLALHFPGPFFLRWKKRTQWSAKLRKKLQLLVIVQLFFF